jgi:hypothetical protein
VASRRDQPTCKCGGRGGLRVVGMVCLTTRPGARSVRVRAINDAGSAGPYSSTLSVATRAASAPSPPRSLSALNITGGEVVVQWLAPIDSGGVALSSYSVQDIAVGDYAWTSLGTVDSSVLSYSGECRRTCASLLFTSLCSLSRSIRTHL